MKLEDEDVMVQADKRELELIASEFDQSKMSLRAVRSRIEDEKQAIDRAK